MFCFPDLPFSSKAFVPCHMYNFFLQIFNPVLISGLQHHVRWLTKIREPEPQDGKYFWTERNWLLFTKLLTWSRLNDPLIYETFIMCLPCTKHWTRYRKFKRKKKIKNTINHQEIYNVGRQYICSLQFFIITVLRTG